MSERRVLMVAADFPPSTRVGAHRSARFARMLPEFGWSPVVLTMSDQGSGACPKWIDALQVTRLAGWKRPAAAEAARDLPQVETAETRKDETSERLPQTISLVRGLKDFARNLRDLFLETPDNNVGWALPACRETIRLARSQAVQAVYTTGPSHSTHLAGRHVKRRLNLPWVADFRDPWARRHWGAKERNPWGQHLLPRLEASCIHYADAVILNTERMAEEFRSHYGPELAAKFHSIPNGCDPELIERVRDLVEERRVKDRDVASGRAKKVYRLCHPGSLYRRRDPRPIVDAVAILRRQGIEILFEQIGSCAAEFELSAYAADRGLSDFVSVEPPIPHEQILARMAGADLFLLVQPGTPTQVPGKLFEMLAYRRPIIALADDGSTADIIRQYELGAVVSGEDPASIAAGISNQLQGRAEEADWDGALEAFDGRELTGQLAALLDDVTGVPRAGGAPTAIGEQAPVGAG